MEQAFASERRPLWHLCYRMTGSAADAEDLVQDTFTRALQQPPPSLEEPLRPWLFRVAVNLARDHLRQRKRRDYVGPWLPEPVDTAALAKEGEVLAPDAHFGLLESASMAFLVALEALTDEQRAVLVLRDVFDYSVREAAEALEISEGAVKVAHHRARKALEGVPIDAPRPELTERTRAVMARFFEAMAGGDVARIEALLTEEAELVSDGAGKYLAARHPVVSASKVARFLLGLQEKTGAGYRVSNLTVNGLPAVDILLNEGHKPTYAPRTVVQFDFAPDGRVRRVWLWLAPDKLKNLESGVAQAQ